MFFLVCNQLECENEPTICGTKFIESDCNDLEIKYFCPKLCGLCDEIENYL